MERQTGTDSSTIDLGGLRVLAVELSALVRVLRALPRRSMTTDTLDDADGQRVPCVLVHGILGDATNFATLRQHLTVHGIRRFSSFSYRPRLDYQSLAGRFGEHVSRVCRDSGAPHVDIIAHSFGGLIARYFVQTGGAHLVRRLVTLGTPYLGSLNPSHEFSIFGRHDALVPPPVDHVRRRMHIVDSCGHLGLLTDNRALAAIAQCLVRATVVAIDRPRRMIAARRDSGGSLVRPRRSFQRNASGAARPLPHRSTPIGGRESPR
jgi:pimeloyl-ACP methyl ester carboxylesterase